MVCYVGKIKGVMVQGTHSRLIKKIARKILTPLGIQQKGDSRLWIDDLDWWLILVEFQPSGFDKGTYLNIGAHWLWYEKDYFSFDYGERIGSFIPFETETQFENEVYRVVEQASQLVKQYRQRFHSIYDAEKVLYGKSDQNVWSLYDAAVASGICGDATRAKRLFQSILRSPGDYGWQRNLNGIVSQLTPLLQDTEAFRNQIRTYIKNSRQKLNLRENNTDLLFEK
jgi:hypothetical protein